MLESYNFSLSYADPRIWFGRFFFPFIVICTPHLVLSLVENGEENGQY